MPTAREQWEEVKSKAQELDKIGRVFIEISKRDHTPDCKSFMKEDCDCGKSMAQEFRNALRR